MWPPMLTMPSKEGANDWVAFWMRQMYTFTVDPQTGHMTHLAVVKESAGMGAQQMALDAENGFLYAASCGDGVIRGFYVFKVAKKSAAK